MVRQDAYGPTGEGVLEDLLPAILTTGVGRGGVTVRVPPIRVRGDQWGWGLGSTLPPQNMELPHPYDQCLHHEGGRGEMSQGLGRPRGPGRDGHSRPNLKSGVKSAGKKVLREGLTVRPCLGGTTSGTVNSTVGVIRKTHTRR